jgi:hypothetical protein
MVTNARESAMFTLSGLREGVARGWAYLHTACPERGRRAHLPVPKIPTAKPCVSISSKLIEIKRLQALHSGHLRKTGGRGSYRLVHTTDHSIRKSPPLTPAFPALARPLTNLSIFNKLQTAGGLVMRFVPNPARPSRRAAATQPKRPSLGRQAGLKSLRYIEE